MTDQRRIDRLFTAAVVAVRTGRAARRAGPAAAMMLMVAVAVYGTLGGTDGKASPDAAAEQPVGAAIQAVGPVPAEAAMFDGGAVEGLVADALPGALAAPEPMVVEWAVSEPAPIPVPPVVAEPVRVAPTLDREQQNVVRFIAQRYRLTIDSTSEFVHHAYRAARDMKLDPMLVLAVMSVESSFDPTAQSHAGAQGLMQVLTRVHVEKFLPFGGIAAAFDPVANIRVGSAILREYLQREGSVEGALKSYVGSALALHDNGYGLKVLNARDRIAAAAAGRPIPPEVSMRAAAAQARARAGLRDEPALRPVSTVPPVSVVPPVPTGTAPVAPRPIDPVVVQREPDPVPADPELRTSVPTVLLGSADI